MAVRFCVDGGRKLAVGAGFCVWSQKLFRGGLCIESVRYAWLGTYRGGCLRHAMLAYRRRVNNFGHRRLAG